MKGESNSAVSNPPLPSSPSQFAYLLLQLYLTLSFLRALFLYPRLQPPPTSTPTFTFIFFVPCAGRILLYLSHLLLLAS
ncbi:hypothetical protein GQ42DRAFT_162849 [Ramicandelaber brevisporus]|nr:hypothetical protein GQ42DRAFT_163942 [Ramicandelaber brevisporus]KAI8870267.1 hypothetical protein GQ42DRAFT_162849 [Ramicandelaber brevisporus]